MIRALLTEGRRLVLTDSRRDPHAALAIHGKAMGVGLAGPDDFLAPVRRWLRRRRLRFARRLGIANLQLHLARGVAGRVHDRHVVGTGLESSVDRSVRVHRWIPLVGPYLV